MISLAYLTATDAIKITAGGPLVFGADAQITLTFDQSPGDVTYLDCSLGSPTPNPSTLAFTDAFTQQSSTVWTALLDCSDTRLATYLQSQGSSSPNVNLQIVAIINGRRTPTPSVSLQIQPANYSGDPTSAGGPTYLTDIQSIEFKGAEASLAAIPTVGLSKPRIWAAISTSTPAVLKAYRVRAGTDVPSGQIASLTITAGGSAYGSPPTVTITGDGTGATATAGLTGGAVTSLTITNAGSGYTNATVSFSSGAAAATAKISAGITRPNDFDPSSNQTVIEEIL